MREKIFIVFLALVFATKFGATVFASPPEYISSETAVLMDAETGQVLYSKYMNQPMHPASITKIMTGLLAAEHCGLDEEMTVSKTAISISSESTSIYLQEGERITVDDGLFSLMIASANDSANVLAEHVAGTQEEFAKLMNQRSAEIGAVNTNFRNAHGLSDPSHITTAYDMALITREAIKNPSFLKHFNMSDYVVPATNKMDRRFLNNHHTLINQNQDYTLDMVGGKTGYTHSAGNTLVTVGEKNGRTLIAVVLKSLNGVVSDTQQLFDFGFQDFEKQSISTSGIVREILPLMSNNHTQIGEAEVDIPDAINILLPKHTNASAVRTELSLPEMVYEYENNPGVLKIYLEDGIPILQVDLEYTFTTFEKVEEKQEELIHTAIPTVTVKSVTFSMASIFVMISLVGGVFVLLTLVAINKH